MANVQEALIEGALLTVLVVFLFLNSWRSTVITGLALPVCVLAASSRSGPSASRSTRCRCSGLSLAIGILIDDAIVVRENIVRHIEMGKDHLQASHEGTDEIGLAVAATTFSIVAVFVPVAFMYGVAGQWFKPFALTIACAVLVSLFVSFSLDPMLSAYWADPQTEAHERRNPIARALDRFNRWFDRQAERYQRLIALGAGPPARDGAASRWARFVGAIVLQAMFGGAGFVPVSDRSEVSIIVETPPGSNLEYTRLKAEEVARIARAHPEVRYTYTAIGTPMPLRAPGVDQALVYVRLVPKHEREHQPGRSWARCSGEELRAGGRGAASRSSPAASAGRSSRSRSRCAGEDPRCSRDSPTQRSRMVRQVPGAVDVGLSTRGEKPELEVELNRGLAGSLGVTVGQVAQSLRPAFAGHRRGRLGGPDRRDAGRDGAAGARGAGADRSTWSGCRW